MKTCIFCGECAEEWPDTFRLTGRGITVPLTVPQGAKKYRLCDTHMDMAIEYASTIHYNGEIEYLKKITDKEISAIEENVKSLAGKPGLSYSDGYGGRATQSPLEKSLRDLVEEIEDAAYRFQDLLTSRPVSATVVLVSLDEWAADRVRLLARRVARGESPLRCKLKGCRSYRAENSEYCKAHGRHDSPQQKEIKYADSEARLLDHLNALIAGE